MNKQTTIDINDLGFDPNFEDFKQEEKSKKKNDIVNLDDIDTEYSLDDILKEQCVEWVTKKISKTFEFREYQLDCIIRIVKNILEHKYQNYVVEAPTGSGKSLINIISAGVLADYYDITSYILVSDLFLWDQYDQFLKKHKKTGIAILKGQTGNYKCALNGEDIKNSECRIDNISWAALFNNSRCEELGYECALKCEYVQARKKAVRAKVCIMTYQLFLFIMNNPKYNVDQKGCPIFAIHDCIFCDECHNIPEIVQLQYSPAIYKEDIEKIKALYHQKINPIPELFSEFEPLQCDFALYNEYPNWCDVEKAFNKWWNIWTCVESRKDEDQWANESYLALLEYFAPIVEQLKTEISNNKQYKKLTSKEDLKMFKICSWYENYMCHWNDFCTAIRYTGYEYQIKDNNIPEDSKKNVKDEDICVTFKCTKEDFITWFFLLQKAQHHVMLSATVGTKDAFDERMGFQYEQKSRWDHENAIVNESYMEVIPSTFNFTESPVYFFNKFKMSFREREISFKHLKTVIYSICNTKFKGQKGMIQTGSYEFAKRLYNDAPEDIKARMLIYNGSREKVSIVNLHKISEDTILVGPTLNTGIDLPGDQCRFIIMLKIPYPTLMDILVHERNKLYPLWYMSHTSNEVIQGIGRGVRYNGDWCVTYILDACFDTLYRSTKNQYPIELQKRIQYI